jgi:TIR domain
MPAYSGGAMAMSRIFISHSSKDKRFVRTLSADLRKLGHRVWLDEYEISVGESIVAKLGTGLGQAEFVIVVLSQFSVSSGWVEREWQAKYWHEVNTGRVAVLPVLLEDCAIPELLRTKKYADFRSDYKLGLISLATSLQPYQSLSGIMRYYPDIVDLVDDWHSLFAQTRHLDLLVMYGGTWRYTYLKELNTLVANPEGRLRAVVPELTLRSSLLQVYAKRLAVKPSDVLERVTVAIEDLKQLAMRGHVEIYTVPLYFYHACYLFDTGGVLALYSYRSARVPTPAFVLSDGELLRFLRTDFEWLVSDDNPMRRVVYRP